MRLTYVGLIFPIAALAAVANAQPIDLTTAGATGSCNGVNFTQTNTIPTGSGFIGSFLRVQATGTETGFNTGGGTPDDNVGGISLNNGDISVSDFLNNNACILLDVNQQQNGPNSLITLTELQIYTSPTHNIATFANLQSQATLVYDLDPTCLVTIESSLASGSGSGDVLIDLPANIFANAQATDAVYVRATFTGSNAGFEEFGLVSDCGNFPPPGGNPPPIPEPVALMTLPLALAGLYLRRRLSN